MGLPDHLAGLLTPGIELIQTNIAWVLLTGERVYKIKRPVKLPFLDLRSPERRRFLGELGAELAGLTERVPTISAEEAIDGLRDIQRSWADDFAGDPVLSHVEDCIEELARIHRLAAAG